MRKNTCKHCGRTFEYCRGCLLLPVSYHDAGFCSKTCQAAYKQKIEEAQTGTRVVLTSHDATNKGIETASENE